MSVCLSSTLLCLINRMRSKSPSPAFKCQWTTALCINCRSIWKQVMAIYCQLRNRLYWRRDAHENDMRLIAQTYYLSICVCLSVIYITIYLSIYLSIYHFQYVYLYPSVYVYHLHYYLSIYLSIYHLQCVYLYSSAYVYHLHYSISIYLSALLAIFHL